MLLAQRNRLHIPLNDLESLNAQFIFAALLCVRVSSHYAFPTMCRRENLNPFPLAECQQSLPDLWHGFGKNPVLNFIHEKHRGTIGQHVSVNVEDTIERLSHLCCRDSSRKTDVDEDQGRICAR